MTRSLTVHEFLMVFRNVKFFRIKINNLVDSSIVFDSRNYWDAEDIITEIDFQGFGDYIVRSSDLYDDISTGERVLEILIEMEEDELDEEDIEMVAIKL